MYTFIFQLKNSLHYLVNVITSVAEEPHAVLIRSLYPLVGIKWMNERRNTQKGYPELTYGPGRTAQALGIDLALYGERLDSEKIWIEDIGIAFDKEKIAKLPRIGIDYAGPDALLPWRFCVENSYLETIIATLQTTNICTQKGIL